MSSGLFAEELDWPWLIAVAWEAEGRAGMLILTAGWFRVALRVIHTGSDHILIHNEPITELLLCECRVKCELRFEHMWACVSVNLCCSSLEAHVIKHCIGEMCQQGIMDVCVGVWKIWDTRLNARKLIQCQSSLSLSIRELLPGSVTPVYEKQGDVLGMGPELDSETVEK